MNRKHTLYILLICLLFIPPLQAQRLEGLSQEALLHQLDEAVAARKSYRNARVAQIDSMGHRAQQLEGIQRAEAYLQICTAYSSIQTDSAMAWLAKTESLPVFSATPELQTRVLIRRAEIYGVMGLYASAQSTVEDIDIAHAPDSIRLAYYQLCRKLYGWMADYGEVYGHAAHYSDLTQRCRDSILAIQRPGINRNIVLADRALTLGDVALARTVCAQSLPKADELQRAYLHFTMSAIAHAEQNTTEEIRYLAMTAINDFRRGVAEYSALPKLAIILSSMGHPDRAYEYLVCAMDDAAYCKARLRTVEASTIFPIIEQNHKQRVRQRFLFTISALLTVALFLVAMAFMLLGARRRNRQLAEMHRKLDDAIAAQRQVNDALSATNLQLQQTNRVKETYIVRYLERCRTYIDSMEQSRKRILKMLRNNRQDEILALLKTDSTIPHEETLFYTDFDEAFLTLFPNFVANFNALLLPEAQITTKRDEMLNTELRIFALIRLGISDSNRIAHFLNYSLPTIYSYRSRLRNKSRFPKEEFEKRVMEC